MYHTAHAYAYDFPDSALLINLRYRYYKKKDVGNRSPAYPTSQALALPLRKDKQRQSAHAIVTYRYTGINKS